MLYEVEVYYIAPDMAYRIYQKFYKSNKVIKPKIIKRRQYIIQRFVKSYEERNN